jgi:hypothetical protein
MLFICESKYIVTGGPIREKKKKEKEREKGKMVF